MKTDKSSVRVIDFEVLSIPENASKNTSKMTSPNLHFSVIFRLFFGGRFLIVLLIIFEPFWTNLGDPWGDLGALLGALGVLLGALGALLGALTPLLSALGVLSGLSWVPLAPNGGPQSFWIRFSTTFCNYFLRAGLCCYSVFFFAAPVCVVNDRFSINCSGSFLCVRLCC